MILAAQGVCVDFGGLRAVQEANLSVAAGELVGLAGTNGAGKSTLFAAIAGQLACSGGSIRFEGMDVTDLPTHRRARLGLGRTFQVPREFGRLSVLENLLAAAPNELNESIAAAWFRRGRSAREERRWAVRAEEVMELLKIARLGGQLASGLSGGQKKLLELGRVLMREPKLILLDEPFAGVNPVLIGQITEALLALRGRGIALVVVEHHLQALKEMADRLVVMDQGRVLAQGDPHAVLDDPRVQAAYMGGVA